MGLSTILCKLKTTGNVTCSFLFTQFYGQYHSNLLTSLNNF